MAHRPHDDLFANGANISKLGTKHLALAYTRGADFIVSHPVLSIIGLSVMYIALILGFVHLYP